MAPANQSPPSYDDHQSIPVLHWGTIDRIIDVSSGEMGLLKELSLMFKTDQPPRLKDMEAAIKSQDMPQIKQIAHAIRGSAGTIGAMRLQAAAAKLEAYGQGRAAQSSPDGLFGHLTEAFEEVRLALDEYINSHSGR